MTCAPYPKKEHNPMPNLKKTYRQYLFYLGTKLAHRIAQKTTRLTLHPEGKPATVFTEGDTTFVRAQGGLRVDIPEIITSVGISNLTEVTEHTITTVVGSRSHLLRFTNGGELRFAYNSLGQLIELRSRDLAANIAPGNVITYAIPDEQAQEEMTS
jgi:hypothetical protein